MDHWKLVNMHLSVLVGVSAEYLIESELVILTNEMDPL